MRLRNLIWALALLGLTGCGDNGPSLSGLFASRDATGEGIRTLALLDGAVRARGPEGYCIDQGASSAGRGFAILAGCALMAPDAAVMPSLDGLITVQFGEAGTASVTGNEEDFAAFLRSEAGRGLLARTGEIASVDEVATITDASAVLARFEDAGGSGIPGTTGPQWRGFLDIGGRLVTVTVLSFERNPLSRAEGERLLVVTMAELAEINAVPDASG